ncbi:ascorbate peroxidase, putative [Medicago truncatula]|uniref:Ascorbate peroxidase, putative n=1 Tax=Medicago truncatula TaxID=3880 RepID=G7L7B2_MEDTR|nr:ascorbate peroxidase, putative [Medicago truncatula]
MDPTLLKLLIQRQRLVVCSEPSSTKLILLMVLVLGANNGLDIVVRLVELLKEQFPIISYSDFYQVSDYIFMEYYI